MEENDFKNTQTTEPGCSEISQDNGATEESGSGQPRTDLIKNIRELQEENRKMQYGFNSQRAKLKELFVQKEREIDELKTKMVVNEMKAQEEIQSLQQLVQETIEESAICKSELEHLKDEGNRLCQENRQLHENLVHHQQVNSTTTTQELSSLAPQVLSQVKKSIVRKLGGDSSGSVLGTSFAQDNSMDESKNKNDGKYSHEDSEVLGSIVIQLQEEMKVLKEKLREADDKLRAPQSELTNSETISTCNYCISLEEKTKQSQVKAAATEEKLESLKKQFEETIKDLEKEAALRTDLENQWQEKREAHKNEVHILREQVTSNEQQLLELQQKFLETKDDVVRQLQRISDDREKVNKHLETLQADNDFLSGRYLATAEEIENQYINLPNNVDELQEVILKQQNELIQARLGCDFEKKRCVTSLDEIQILRDQLEASNHERAQYKKKFQTEIKLLQDRITQHLMTLQNYETTKTALERKESELNKQISAFRVEIIELQEQNEKLSKNYADSKLKNKNLQDDLSTSEQVQKDFVQLSQTLQMTLEQLRHADSEVRWQEDDDVANCPACNNHFTVTVRKIHCRHCGHIYCDKCLTKNVLSGPRKRPARVCDICHTLLTPNIAPYFSQESVQQTSASTSS